MTRINSAINVLNLTDEHLLAEHREIKRIPSVYSKHNNKNKIIPPKFTLGTGHVLFFINKPFFTILRYKQLYEECLKRNFKVENYIDNWNVYENVKNGHILNDHVSSMEEYHLLLDRITERITNTKKPYWHYYGNVISKEDAVTLLHNR